MSAQRSLDDEPFFEEWLHRGASDRRDLDRAREIGTVIGALPQRVPVIHVVGSKGKGSAAAGCAAALSVARLPSGCRARVGLITSPALGGNRERVRLDGRAISPGNYTSVSARVKSARDSIPRRSGGYLSPTGGFTMAGMAWLTEAGVDVVVLEEGLGGSSDEISLFVPEVVIVTHIFGEHMDVLGDSIDAVARDLLGVVRPTTRSITTFFQQPEVSDVLADVSNSLHVPIHVLPEESGQVDSHSLTPRNINLGQLGASIFADAHGWALERSLVERVSSTLNLPGRSSWHSSQSGTRMLIDGAISPDGVVHAVSAYVAERGQFDTVLACFPDSKDAVACFSALRGFRSVVPIAAGRDYLTYAASESIFVRMYTVSEGLEIASRDESALIVGTQSFISEVLTLLRVPTDPVYEPGDLVHRAVTKSGPLLIAITKLVEDAENVTSL